MMIRSVLLLCLCLHSLNICSQVKITGQLDLDSTWAPIIHASEILSFQDMYHCSQRLIIATDTLGEDGQYTLNIAPSNQTSLVRLSVSKVNSPAASLVIGGAHQNHGFYMVKNGRNYQVNTCSSNYLFQSFCMEDTLNRVLRALHNRSILFEEVSAAEKDASERKTIEFQYLREMMTFCDTTSHSIAATYALLLSDMGHNKTQLLQKAKSIKDNLGVNPFLSMYLPSTTTISKYLFAITMIVLFTFLGLMIRIRYFRNPLADKVIMLSPQERNVALHLSMGKRNKEIANEMHIEISTVKSHVHRILVKLEIGSRREVHKFKKYLS